MVAPIQIEHVLADHRRNVSRSKRRANRRNAQKSTGPRTPDGKARAAQNATTHAIFCRAVLLPGEDEHRFHLTRADFIRALKPHDEAQLALVETMIVARWRLERCLATEAELIDDITYELADIHCEQRGGLKIVPEQDNPTPGVAVASLLREHDQPLERLSRIEQRLHGQFHRCLRDLHALKQHAKAYADEPESRYLGEGIATSAPSPGTPGEARDDAQEHATASRPGLTESGSQAKVQNEPTAEKTAASLATPDACDDASRQLGHDARVSTASDPDDRPPRDRSAYDSGVT